MACGIISVLSAEQSVDTDSLSTLIKCVTALVVPLLLVAAADRALIDVVVLVAKNASFFTNSLYSLNVACLFSVNFFSPAILDHFCINVSGSALGRHLKSRGSSIFESSGMHNEAAYHC